MGLPNWQDYPTVFANKDKIYQRAYVLKNMPPVGASTISDDERSELAGWINAGAPESLPDNPTPGPEPDPVPTPAPEPPPSPQPPAPVPGFKGKLEYCTQCHGKSGEGFQGVYSIPRLAGLPQEYLVNQLAHFVDHTRNNPASKQFMWGAVSNLSVPMREALASYFSALKAPPFGGGPGGSEALGKTIFEQGVPSTQVLACNMSHGQNGEGNGAIPRLAGQNYFYLKTMFEDWRHGYRADAAPMPDFAKALTDTEIESLAEYLSKQK